MLRPIPRLLRTSAPRQLLARSSPPRRYISLAPPSQKRHSWKGAAARWGLAIGGLWWYNTTDVFADDGTYLGARIPATHEENESLPTVDVVAASRRDRQRAARSTSTPPSSQEPASSATNTLQNTPTSSSQIAPIEAAPNSPEELEEEAAGEGAFNEETGEINWDCPCLGGMAHGPCGPEFREAFSCFVYSKEEPKGVDCIDRFKSMQDCFRAHPDIYGAELSDDADDEAEFEASHGTPLDLDSGTEDNAQHAAASAAPPQDPVSNATTKTSPSSSSVSRAEKVAGQRQDSGNEQAVKTARAKDAKAQVREDHAQGEISDSGIAISGDSGIAVPEATHDASGLRAEKYAVPPRGSGGVGLGDQEEGGEVAAKTARAKEAKAQVQRDHGQGEVGDSGIAVPKAWHDASGDGIRTEK